MGPEIKTNILKYTRLYIEIIEVKILYGQRLWGMIVDSLIKELKVGPQYTQVIILEEGFLHPTNSTITVELDTQVQRVD